MVNIKEMLLTNHNRPRSRLRELKGVVMHWTANTHRGSDALANRNFFNNTSGSVSAHYIVDDTLIVRCVPDDEVAYHVGAKQYTRIGESIREGSYSPNYYLIGIEMCVNSDGDWKKTYAQSVELAAYLLRKYNLTTDNLYRHYDITGKACPSMMIDANAWNRFKVDVTKELIQVKVVVNGKQLDVTPIIKDSTTYVPVRAIAEALNAKVDWDGANNTVVIQSKTAKRKQPGGKKTPKENEPIPSQGAEKEE